MDTINTLINNRLNEGSQSININDIAHIVKAVCGRMKYMDCEYFNSKYALEQDYVRYIMYNQGIELAHEEHAYHEHSYGSVYKKTICINGKYSHRYTIVLPPSVKNNFDRVFTLGHELAHVLLHGRLLIADQCSPKKSSAWFNPSTKMPIYMEIEANALSLHYMMPKRHILAIYSKEKTFKKRLKCCKEMMLNVYGEDLPPGLMEGRLLAHELGNCEEYMRAMENSEYAEICKCGLEWLVFGQAMRIREFREISKPPLSASARILR